jgi:hypothetical protein
MTPDQPRPPHGSKDPETGLFCWRDNKNYFRWVTLEKYESLLADRARYAKKYRRKKKALKKSKRASARSSMCPSYEKNILGLHKKGKSMFYISSLYNMKISRIKEVIENSAP